MGGGMGTGMPGWTSNVTARGTIMGPAGLTLANLPDRIIAYVIDAIILGIIGFIVSTITTSILGDNFLGIFGIGTYKVPSLLSTLLTVVIMLAVSAAYFIYMWTRMGGSTVGMRVTKIGVRDANSGGPITQNQAIYRWALLYGPWALNWFYQWSIIGWLIWLIALGWEIYLLYTTANSPTRQGFHDTYVKTVVAKTGM
jgi:uncharacterized RDD family membrane protein YckC